MLKTLFPAEPRDFPYRRSLRILLRTLHILATGVLLGGCVFNQPAAALAPWLTASAGTGLALVVIDLHASLMVLVELRGLMLLIKLLLLILIPVFWDLRIHLLVIVLFLGAIGSHMPKSYRHKILLPASIRESFRP